jgi:hypothetical protein
MATVAASYLDNTLDWMPSDYYTNDLWRNIADESWCLRLFIVTNHDQDLTKALIQKMIGDTDQFIHAPNISESDKLAVVYHALYVLADYEETYHTGEFTKERLSYADYISYFSYKKLQGNTLMTSNLLDVMVHAQYDNPEALKELANTVLSVQEADGKWKMNPDAPPNDVQVFTTFRALISLNEYKKVIS